MVHHCDLPAFAMLKLLSHAESLPHPRRLQKGRCSEQQVVAVKVMLCCPPSHICWLSRVFYCPSSSLINAEVVATCRNPSYVGSSDSVRLSTSDFNINIRGLQAPAPKGGTTFLARSGSACPWLVCPWAWRGSTTARPAGGGGSPRSEPTRWVPTL